MAKAVELPFFIHGEALYGRATETERELFIGGYCRLIRLLEGGIIIASTNCANRIYGLYVCGV